MTVQEDDSFNLVIITVTQGQWGERIAENIHRFSPSSWIIHRWSAPRALPPLIDDPEEFLPPTFPKADLILALGDTAGVAQLIPDIARMSGAKAVIAPIDRNESLPSGLVKQLKQWLDDLNVASVFPKPFCSLTESTYNQPPIVVNYDNPLIKRFAQSFGKPQLHITVDADKHISQVDVARDSACGCAHFVAQGLTATVTDDAEYEAGMLHHHFPCLASMNQDADYGDTLMHVSGHILRTAVKEEIKDHLSPTQYLQPQGRTE